MDGSTGLLDNSDIIVPDELPNWHIESKATKDPHIAASKLKKWCEQVKADCPPGKLGVIITIANGYNPIAILTSDVYISIALNISSMTVCTDGSFSPAIELQKLEKGARTYGALIGKAPPSFAGVVAYEPVLGVVVAAVDAELWLRWAAAYEQKLKDLKNCLKEQIKEEKEHRDKEYLDKIPSEVKEGHVVKLERVK